jgi:shikimate dehydrogenase
VDVRGRECVVLGAGGSARAVVYALLREGARIHLMARREEQAVLLSADLHAAPNQIQAHPWDPARISRLRLEAPLIVNTTPLGMADHADQSPWPATLPLPHGAFVYDLVYNPAETRFMQQARDQGCRTANGLGMLLHQGAQAFHLWTGRQPDLTVMRAALLAGLQ